MRSLLRGRWVSSGLFRLPAGLTVEDVDIFEINEAFASQVSPCFALLPGPPSWRQRAGGVGDWGGSYS